MEFKSNTQIIAEAYITMIEDNNILNDILALDEISKTTLGNYIKQASQDAAEKADKGGILMGQGKTGGVKQYIKATKRIKGIAKATDKLTKEQKESIESILTELEEDINLDEGTHYHSVWVKTKGDNEWSHHFDADNKEDADDEKRSCKNNGEKCKVIKVHKDQADWRKPEHREAAIKKLNESDED